MIKIGPASIGDGSILKEYKRLGFKAAEVEFVYSVYMNNNKAKEVGKLAKDLDIELSVHAPYYCNLASKDKETIEKTKKRILDSCERSHYLNAKYVVFHPGYYLEDKEKTFQIIKDGILEMQKIIKKNNWNVKLAPEVMGKKNVFGHFDEILRLVNETGCHFCMDFAHFHAREGRIDYKEVLDKIKHFDELHCHFSGIEFGDKGEKRHILTEEKELGKLINVLKEHKKKVIIINESPDPVQDSIRTLKILNEI